MKFRQQTGALLWILCVQFFLAEQFARRAWKLSYSFSRNYISDLGAIGCHDSICSPLHALMNGSFVLQGIFISLGATFICSHPRLIEKMTLSMFLLSGLGVFMVGFIPEDTNNLLHTAFAAMHFLFGAIGILSMALASLRGSRHRPEGWFSLLIGLSVLAATLLLAERHSSHWQVFQYPGAIERIASYGIILWLTASGIRVLSGSRSSQIA